MVIIGVDCHTRVHVAAAIDGQGQVGARYTAGAKAEALAALTTWACQQGAGLVAVEGARGFGLALTRCLIAAGLEVVDVPTRMTADGRRQGRHRGKDDESDAVVIARVALREHDLPRLRLAHLDADIKLLVDARDQLVAEGTRVRNRLHALLLTLSPGYREETGALSSKRALIVARRLALRARVTDPVRGRLAAAAVRRLFAIDAEAAEFEREIKQAVGARHPKQLLAICGVSTLVAGKLLGETHDITRFPTAASFASHAGAAPVPASSGITRRYRLNRGGNRQLNRALFTIAMVQARWHPDAVAYLERKRAEGKRPAEARRCLMRHLANVVHRAMLLDADAVRASSTMHAA
jgi:transposase